MNCDFSNPQVFYNGQMVAPASSTPDYAPVVFASSSCQNSSSTGAIFYNGFSSGEIILACFAVLIFVLLLFQFFAFKFFGIKIHKSV